MKNKFVECTQCGKNFKVTAKEFDEYVGYLFCKECRKEFKTECSGSDYFENWEETHRGTPGYEGGEKIEEADLYYSDEEDSDEEDED